MKFARKKYNRSIEHGANYMPTIAKNIPHTKMKEKRASFRGLEMPYLMSPNNQVEIVFAIEFLNNICPKLRSHKSRVSEET